MLLATTMNSNSTVMLLFGLWAALVAAGFLHATLYDASGDGLAGGAIVLFIFLLWNLAALAAAISLLVVRLMRRTEITGGARWLGFLPITLSGAFALFVAGWIAYSVITGT